MDDGNGPYYNESQLDLIEYGNETVPQSPFFSATNGLFEMTTYYADIHPTSEIPSAASCSLVASPATFTKPPLPTERNR